MPPETLEFEEPIAVLLKEIEALDRCRARDAREREIESLRRRLESVRAELYATLTPWQRVLVARHPNRPGLEDFIQRLFTGFVEIHGDRRFADDHAIMTGFAEYHGQPVLLVGPRQGQRHQGEDLPELRLRAAGGLPEGAAGDAAGREVRPARSSSSSIRRPRIPASNPKSGASPKRSP